MSIQQEYLSQWVGYWIYLSNQTMKTWLDATRKIQKEEYSVGKFFADATEFWNGAAAGWWGLAKGIDKSIPTVLFELNTEAQASPEKTIPVFAPAVPDEDPRVLWLGHLGDEPKGGKRIEEGNCRAYWADNRTTLKVCLVDLVNKEKKTLAPGTYHGLVHVGDVPVARFYVLVFEAADERSRKSADADRKPAVSKPSVKRS